MEGPWKVVQREESAWLPGYALSTWVCGAAVIEGGVVCDCRGKQGVPGARLSFMSLRLFAELWQELLVVEWGPRGLSVSQPSV